MYYFSTYSWARTWQRLSVCVSENFWTTWSDLAEILYTCSLGECVGVIFLFFKNFDFLGLGTSFSQLLQLGLQVVGKMLSWAQCVAHVRLYFNWLENIFVSYFVKGKMLQLTLVFFSFQAKMLMKAQQVKSMTNSSWDSLVCVHFLMEYFWAGLFLKFVYFFYSWSKPLTLSVR